MEYQYLSLNKWNTHVISSVIYLFLVYHGYFRTEMIYHGYFENMNAFSAGKRRFYGAVYMIHDVIRTANPFPYTAEFMFFGVRNDTTQQR